MIVINLVIVKTIVKTIVNNSVGSSSCLSVSIKNLNCSLTQNIRDF